MLTLKPLQECLHELNNSFFKCIKLLSMKGKKILHGIFGYGKIKMVSAHPTALDIQIEG